MIQDCFLRSWGSEVWQSGNCSVREKTVRAAGNEPLSIVPQKHTESGVRSVTLTVPELEQSKTAVLNMLASTHSHRSYAFAIDRFIAWYCSEPRLTFNRAVVVRYRSHLESLRLISLHDQSASFSDSETGE